MRFYPEQKTRALRGKGKVEDAEIRARSPLSGASLLRPALRPAARLMRIVSKLAAGGYTAKPPASLVQALERYRIERAPA
jgi:hypothetical protein